MCLHTALEGAGQGILLIPLCVGGYAGLRNTMEEIGKKTVGLGNFMVPIG